MIFIYFASVTAKTASFNRKKVIHRKLVTTENIFRLSGLKKNVVSYHLKKSLFL